MKGGRVPIHIMRWAPADYVNDPFVRLLISEEDFATLAFYHLVLNWSHMEGGDLSSDPRQLAASLGMRRHRVVRSLQVCVEAGKLTVENGRLYHRRVVREVRDELTYRAEQAALGRKGGETAGRGRPKESTGVPLIEDRATPTGTDRPAVRRAPAPAPAPNERTAPGESAGPPANPLLKDRRIEMEREVLAMVGEVATLTGDDPIEVMAKASGYEGATRTKLNPATMSADRLANTWRDLKADLVELRKRKGAHGAPA